MITMDIDTCIGALAAMLTTAANIPQLQKCWQTGSTADLSLRMYVILATGVALWAIYGFLKADAVIMAANGTTLALLLAILGMKLRELNSASRRRGPTSG